MVFATVPDAPPTWKNRRATSWPAPISAKVPYFFASRLVWNAFLFVPTSISAFIRSQDVGICGVLNRRTVGTWPWLHSHSLGGVCRDPSAEIVRQSCVEPIAPLAQNLDLTA